MNYFGHASIASWRSGAGAFVLGAMLPDFASMCGGHVAGADDAETARGIDLHHATDSAFHPLPVVVGLMRELDGLLERGGCARGPRRAVAHIGTELLLDGALVDEPAYRAAYLAALEPGVAERAGIRWRDEETAARFAALMARLRGYGAPDDLEQPASIAMRLARTLAHRPRLAPNADDMRAIRGALAEQQARVTVAAETVMRGMRAALP